jgi:hypothetical protein
MAAWFAVVSLAVAAPIHAQTLSFQQRADAPTTSGGFGRSVAVDGTTMVVGAEYEPVAGNSQQGAAYVYTKSGSTWTQQQRLVAADGAARDGFGYAVSISGDRLVVGAPMYERIGTAEDSGAAYIYRRSGSTWALETKIMPSDRIPGVEWWYGYTVKIVGTTVLIGSPSNNTTYVYTFNGTAWVEQQMLRSPAGASVSSFGHDLDISGDSACITAQWADANGLTTRGRAFVYTRSGATWSLQQEVNPSDGAAYDFFGRACDIDGDTLVVSALAAAGPGHADAGAAYVFTRTGSTWTQRQKLQGSDRNVRLFGWDVALLGNQILVGAPEVVSTVIGRTGAVYLFEGSGASWTERQRVIPVGLDGSRFGDALAFDATSAYVGVPACSPNCDAGAFFVYARVTGTPGAPGAPGNFAATVTGSTITMSWSAPSAGAVPTGYSLLARTTPGAAPLVTLPLGLVTSYGVVAPNGSFVLSVVATNAAGTSPESNTATVTVPQVSAPPGAPSGLAATAAGTTVTFTWNAPATGGTPTSYTLIAGTSPGFTVPLATVPLPTSPRSFSVAGVPPGTYYVRLFAQNSGGTSPASSEVSLTVAGASAPLAPVLNPPSVSGGTVNLSWTPGGGGAPTGYTLTATATPSGSPLATVPLTGTSASFPGVPSGTYYLRLTAANAAGTSASSNQVTLVVP